MYPGATVPSFEASVNFAEFNGLTPEQFIDKIQNVYPHAFFQQLQYLTIFSTALFEDISNDMNFIRQRVSSLSTKIQDLKNISETNLNFLSNQNSEYFLKNSPTDITFQEIPSNDQTQPGIYTENLEAILNEPANELNFDSFKGVGRVTDPEEIKKRITNPSILLEQYVEELAHQFAEMEEAPRQPKEPIMKPQQMHTILTQQESDAMINAYTGIVRKQARVLVGPPPPGTKDWRQYASTLPVRGSSSSTSEEQEIIPPHERKPRPPKKPRPVHVPKPKPAPKPNIPVGNQNAQQQTSSAHIKTEAFTSQSSTQQSNANAPQQPPPSVPANIPPPPPPPPQNLPPPPPPPPANLPPPPTNLPPPPKTAPPLPKGTGDEGEKKAPAATNNPQDFLALIKAGNFKLKKVEKTEQPASNAAKPAQSNAGAADIAQLLLMEMQRRREGIKSSSSDSEEEEESDSDSDW